jgi:adenylate cyclase
MYAITEPIFREQTLIKPERIGMQEVKNWIMSEGRLESDPLSFVEKLCQKINEAGIPLNRMRIGFSTIHPQIDIWAYIWSSTEPHASVWGGEHGIRYSASYYGSPAEWVHKNNKHIRKNLRELKKDIDHNILFEHAEMGLTDYVMAPMSFQNETGPIITFVTANETGFSDKQVDEMIDLVQYVAPVIEIHASRKIATTLLDTYLGHRSGSRVLSGQVRRGEVEHIEAALWFCDLRNYTHMSETLNQSDMLDLLNRYFQILSDVTNEHEGEILKFIGDAAMIIFPVEGTTTPNIACEQALLAAKEAFRLTQVENNTRMYSGQPRITFGLGLHFGKVVYGNVGAVDRLDFTVMGPAVNMTSRLEGLTKENGRNLLMSEEFADHLDGNPELVGEYSLKGIQQKQKVYTDAIG